MKYQVIIFDADETLFDFKKSEREALKNTMVEFHIDYYEKYHLKIYQDINSAIWKDFENGLITQEKLKVERFKRLSRSLKVDFDEVKFAHSYMKHLSNASFLYDDSISLVESLYKDYRLSIITNGLTKVQDKRIRKSIIAKYFEDIVISEEVKVSKPSPKIFEYALNNLNYKDKSKVLMVGDSLTSDIQGGINFSIDTCWFNPCKSANETGIKPTYEISNLMELKDMLLAAI
ncbi:putative hydrolase of the HAD superfamily [Clostridium amylolyticum]|uniref:Putative hydrolase of the HAD superfamily n=1 Tax=Clostridium amylolyticum TaxID=1121298 RepID=A0A1M6LZS5_9CLOT|nr:YjjG family noncanonical pyrimidine nucleotidase [Clostridium amylolyticum]SHJ76668.1 putative hydrolase of the HAD superfamily [Clostridium amylolyticum]